MNSEPSRRQPLSGSFAEMFTPKLVTVLREGYGLGHLRADMIAGLTVAIVALPLSMAIAIASGVSPDRGIYAAIVGGFFVSLLGGSRFQIGGPAGAFIVLVAGTVVQHGVDGLLLAVILSGVMLLAIGLLRLGTYIKYVPYPVTVGFTAGIAVIIFASQVSDLLGLTLDGPEPGPFLEKFPVLWGAIGTINPVTVVLAALTIAMIVGLKRLRPQLPGLLIAVVVTSGAAAVFGLPVATIGTAFGGIPGSLPMPQVPPVSWPLIVAVLPNAIAFALLGAIESLLSAVVADGMTGRRHRSNCELVGQGVANVASGLMGGICVTGTIARTATNVRAGAQGPIAGIFHALFLLLFVLVAAPLASFIPLAALAGVLAVVAWNMIEKRAFMVLLRSSRGDAMVLMVTFLLTVFRDLTEAIVVGFGLGAVLFIHRMAQTTAVDSMGEFVPQDRPDRDVPYEADFVSERDVVVYRVRGVLFFGAVAGVASVLDRIGDTRRALVIDLSAVPFLDSTAANMLEGVAHKTKRQGIKLYLTGASNPVRRELLHHGLRPPLAVYAPSIKAAVEAARRVIPTGA